MARVGIVLLAVVLAGGCSKTDPEDKAEDRIDDRTQELRDFDVKREAYAAEIEAMDTEQLARRLEEDSRRASDAGAEPFNSVALKEMVSRGENAGPELAKLLRASDGTSLLGLLALRQMGPAYGELDPGFRVAVLVGALQSSKYFNSWGLPHLYWEDGARAIIELGDVAEPALVRLLGDERPAPSWGSDEVIEYETYKYRVRDYAWALIREIRGEKGDIPTDPAERDRLIAPLLAQPRG